MYAPSGVIYPTSGALKLLFGDVESISELLRYAVPGWWRRGWVGHTPWTKLPL